jgi:hypothetical protein
MTRAVRSLLAMALVALLAAATMPTATGAPSGPARCLQRTDAYGYSCTPIPFAFQDILATGTCAPQGLVCMEGDDEVSDPIALPFPFTFYGQEYLDVYVTTNGLVLFDDDPEATDYQPMAPPSLSGPQPFIAGYWTDQEALTPAVGFEDIGDGERFILQWSEIGLCCSTPGINTFQVVLFPDGSIEVHHLSVFPNDGQLALVGLENAAGNIGLRAARDGLYHSELAWRFTPPPAPRAAGLAPDLFVEFLGGDPPDLLTVGETTTVSLLMSNRAETPATGVLTRVTVPGNVEVTDVHSQCSLAGRTVTCDFGDPIVSSGSDEFDITFTALRPGNAPFLVRVSGAERDLVPADNMFRWTTRIVADRADLNVIMFGPTWLEAEPDNLFAVILNDGSQTAAGVVVRVRLPASVAIDELPLECVLVGLEHVCEVGDLEAGANVILGFVLHAASPSRAMVQARATTGSPEYDLSNNAERLAFPTFVDSANLEAEWSFADDPFLPVAEAVGRAATISNDGPGPATNVRVRMMAPPAMPFDVDAGWTSSDGGLLGITCTQSVRVLACTIPLLAEEESVEFGFVVEAARAGIGVFAMTASSSTPDPDRADNSATLPVYAVPDLGA